MHICIGGDLDGEVVANRKGAYLKASEIDPNKTSTYKRQTYFVGENKYYFWLCAESPFIKTSKIANRYLAEKLKRFL
ncbi:hypothetical protein [Acinetobacter dispersus]|uniref:hypothetical protein n=1 Tax=Acinetobacter dispersus TaxID=70348 RepID=UPI001F4AEB0E|nr:hypothetical protein [Acinetobacter dispersus]MCH7389551.1 hypothetical protein [Acinetobacter dispersus]